MKGRLTLHKNVELYTDGACSGNPGVGGYGVILSYNGREKEISGGEEHTTNNRMELTAVIVGLEALKEPCAVTVYSDSKYVVDAMNEGWAEKWHDNNWMRNSKEPALNPDLWEELLGLTMEHDVTFVWVKGHAGHPQNERCDKLATSYIEKLKKELSE